MRRFSIRSLMAAVFLSAVSLAAFRNAGELWAGMLLLAALTAVGVALMGVVILRGKEQYWCAGFAFFGGGYLALAIGPWLSDVFNPQLGTTYMLGLIYVQMHPTLPPTNEEIAAVRLERQGLMVQMEHVKRNVRSPLDPALLAMTRALASLDQQIATFNRTPSRDQYQRVGHSPFALLAGLPGGMVATWFYVRRERDEAPEAG